MTTQIRRAITLIEVLIVIAIIGVIVQLILPAVQAARESSRQIQCKNNLHQLAIGCTLHTNAQNHFPTGGWTSRFVGDPNRGFGKKQPGGWAYNILPYVEEQDVHDIGKGLPDDVRRKVAAQMYGTCVPIFVCPSRHAAEPQPFGRNKNVKNVDFKELERLGKAGRSDYAGNLGKTLPPSGFYFGPDSYEEGDRWENGADPKTSWVAMELDGIFYQRSEVTPAMVTDGLSKTIVLGEKWVPPMPKRSTKLGNDQSMYVGFSADNNRAGNPDAPPIPDGSIQEKMMWRFGSAHSTGFNTAFCDGSVHQLAVEIDPQVFSAMCTRNQGDEQQLND